MTRVHPITKDEADKNVIDIYNTIEKQMGRLPNIFQNMGNSPAVLKAYLSMSDALNQTSLSAKMRELIALIVGQTNNCGYCLSAHTAIAHNSGLTDQEIIQARKGFAADPKTQAILTFAKTIVEKRANVTDQEVDDLKAAGINDTEIVEIIFTVITNIFTNYFNHITDPKIDFPIAPQLH